MKVSPIFLLLFWLVEPCLAEPPASSLRRFEFQRTLMGVPFVAAFYAPDEASANKAIEAAWARIEHLNSLMSDYDSNSELMRMCRDSRPGQPIRVSPELFQVLCKSAEVSELSDGAFDVSVGPLVKLWRRARRQKELPDPKLLQEARELVGYRNMRLHCESGSIELLKSGMKLDLGGIAVGYAADEAIRVLKQHGITRAMIDGSGDIVVSDPPPGTTGWRIGIASLKEPDAPPKEFATLANCSISTSGDAYQFVEVGGQRYSHIVNPKTGLGLTERCSVTVIAPDGITADALATAVSVLGPERGLKLIELQPCTAALFASLADDRLITRKSACWITLVGDFGPSAEAR
jgi:thiamine biosynthesis lipoprotein